MSDCRVLFKDRLCWLTVALVVIVGLGTLSCKKSEEASTFYLRSCDTGRLVGPIHLTPGHTLPSLEEDSYVVAKPSQPELATRRLLIETKLYESHHFDNDVEELIETIRRMSKQRIGEEAPVFRVDDVHALITMDIAAEEPAYEVLFRIAVKAKARIFIEDGAVILSRRKLTELANLDPTTNDMVARRGLPSR